MKLRISICIPTYNRLDSLIQTLSSIEANKSLYQQEFEIVISDDSDNENTKLFIQKLNHNKIRYIKNKHKGQFNSLNNLVKESRYDWLLFLHDDDLLDYKYFTFANQIIRKNTNIDFIWTGRELIDEDNNLIQVYLARNSKYNDIIQLNKSQLRKNVLHHINNSRKKQIGMMVTGLLIKKKLVEKVGGFDLHIPVNSDGLFINKIQLSAQGAVYINIPLVKYRVSNKSERGKPSANGLVYQEMKKIKEGTLSHLKTLNYTNFIQMEKVYSKNFYKQALLINGPLMWTALRYSGTYRQRIRKQFLIIKDVHRNNRILLFYPYSLTVIILSLFPQSVLSFLYKKLIKYL